MRRFGFRYKKPVKSRFVLLFFAFAMAFAFLITRLFFIQIINYDKYAKIAENSRTAFVTLSHNRGLILDRNLEELVVNLPRQSVYAVPKYIKDKDKFAGRVAEAFHLDEESIRRKISNDKMFVWIARKLPDEEALKLKALKLDGIGLVPETKRVYPLNSLGAHVLGFVGIDNNGLEGIEKYYDTELRGSEGYKLAMVDAKRRQVSSVYGRFMPPRNGYDIVLTIDAVIQHIAEKALLEGVNKYHPKSASAVVMDPSNGDILALCNWPTYNLNDYATTPVEVIKNRAITDILEPGSSFKIITASAVMEEQIIDPEDEFYCENGTYRILGRVLHDHKPYGTLKFKNVIEVSSNIGAVKAAQKLGSKKLYNYIQLFGFGRKTGIGLPGEVRGIVRHVSEWTKGSILAIPIGQEIAVTVLQLAAAISCVANNGILVKPRIVMKMVDNRGALIKQFKPRFIRRVISKETALKMKKILRMAVDSGTGRKASVNGYSAAGKTGTAQRLESDGSYSQTKFNAVFIGFAPEKDPRLAIAVVFIEPHPYHYGGTVTAPVFSEIAGKALRYMAVQPDLPVGQENRL